jgi:hypothetical protein
MGTLSVGRFDCRRLCLWSTLSVGRFASVLLVQGQGTALQRQGTTLKRHGTVNRTQGTVLYTALQGISTLVPLMAIPSKII